MRRQIRWIGVGCQLVIGLLVSGAVVAAEPDAPGREEAWVDQRYKRLTESTDKLANWIDGFFSETRSVEEAAETIIRVRPGYQWDEDDGSDWRLRLTGRLFLPATTDRLSVVFFGEKTLFIDDKRFGNQLLA